MSASDGCQMEGESYQTASEGRRKGLDKPLKVTVYLDPPTFEDLKRLAEENKTNVAVEGGKIIRRQLLWDRVIFKGDFDAFKKMLIEDRVPEKLAEFQSRFQRKEVKRPLQTVEIKEKKRRDWADYLTIGMFGVLVFFAGLLLLALIIPYLP